MRTHRDRRLVKWADALSEKYDISTDLVFGLLDEQYGHLRAIYFAKQRVENFLHLYFKQEERKE